MSFLKSNVPTALCAAVIIGLVGCEKSGGGDTPPAPAGGDAQAVTPAGLDTTAAPAADPAPMAAETAEHGHDHGDSAGNESAAVDSPTPREVELEAKVKELEAKVSNLVHDRTAPGPDLSPMPSTSSSNPQRTEGPQSTNRGSGASGPTSHTTRGDDPKQATKSEHRLDAGSNISRSGAGTPKPEKYKDFGDPVIIVSEGELKLGQIPVGGSRTGTVTLTNTGDRAFTLQKCKTSCGCTTANCKVGTVLEPGGDMEVDIKLTGGTVERDQRKTVTFLFMEHPPVQMVVQGTSVAFVKIEPARLDPDAKDGGRVVLTSTDGQPFSVKGVTPPIIDPEVFPTESALEHELFIDWDKWRELGGRQRRVNFTVDHPETKRLVSVVYIRPKAPIRGQTAPNQGDIAVKDPNTPQAATNTRPKPAAPEFDAETMLREKKIDELITLIQDGKIDVNHRGRAGKTILLSAAQTGELELCEVLIDASADIEAADQRGFTALKYAIGEGDLEIVQFLMDAGADISSRDQLGNTPLNWAAWKSTPEIVKELINAGGFIDDVQSITGYAPLVWASYYGQPGVTKAIIDAGADLEIRDRMEGATPLMFAIRRTMGDPIVHMQMLLDAGADIEATTKQGQTPFLVGATSPATSVEVLQKLVDAGANVNAVDANGENAIQIAQRRKDAKAAAVVEFLKTIVKTEGE